MPVMRSHARRRLLTLTAVGLTLFGLVPAPAFAAVTAEPSADQEAIVLPPLPSGLGEDDPCTKASDTVAEARSWAVSTLGLTRAHQHSRGAGVTVAVVDTGVGTEIPALAGRVTAVGQAGADCVGHGSFTAGIIAAAPVEGSGVLGVAPAAKVLALAGTDDRGRPSPARVAQAIRAAADHGAGVVYVGLALKSGKKEITAAVAYAAERDALVVAPAAPDTQPKGASGSARETTAVPVWPAASPGVLSVTDYGPSGGRPEQAPPAYRPDLAAPGGEVVSTGPSGSGHYIGTGSSLAAATVAGTAALLRAHHPGMSADQVARRLAESAYPADVPRVDPYAALTVVRTDKPDPTPRAARESTPQLPPGPDTAPRTRALALAGGCLALVLLVAGAGVVIPRGRARRWLPPGR